LRFWVTCDIQEWKMNQMIEVDEIHAQNRKVEIVRKEGM
jgi:hypothetical protein